jgi:NAD(P)-dependent dehydrogenase (short-subunit alcohol dehydrogenase family)
MENTARFPSLEGRTAVVTGGASGIGAALVAAFCAQGARTAFLDIDDAAAAKTCADAAARGAPPPLFLKTDLTDATALKHSFAMIADRFGPVRVLVNNAARDDRQDFAAITPESWARTMALNLDHVAFAAQAVRAGMAAAGGGSIVNLSSNNVLMGASGMAGYVTAKAGIVGLTKALARELGSDNIRVNCVMPGWVMTERQKALWARPDDVAQALREQCLKTELQPDDMCGLVLFLASDDSRVVTKQVFVADGGRA